MKAKDFYGAAYIAIFGGMWGCTEILLGNVLHVLDVPFTGTIMSAIGCIICLVGSWMIPDKNKLPILSIGLVAMLIRLLSFGMFKIHIFLSMFTETVFLQLFVSLLGYNFLSFILAGVFSCFAPYISSALFFGLAFGQGLAFLQHGIIKDTHSLAWLLHSVQILLLVALIIHIFFGVSAGVFAFKLGRKLRHVDTAET